MAARRHAGPKPATVYYRVIFENHPISLEGCTFSKRQAFRGYRNGILATGTLLRNGRATYWLGERNGKLDLWPIKGRKPNEMADEGGTSALYCTACGTTAIAMFRDRIDLCYNCQTLLRRASRT